MMGLAGWDVFTIGNIVVSMQFSYSSISPSVVEQCHSVKPSFPFVVTESNSNSAWSWMGLNTLLPLTQLD
jgi:hypothetical protein